GYYRVGFDLQISRSLVAADWYAPGDTRQLNADDHDLGGASALLVPPQSDEIARLLVTGDKAGNVYLLSSANLGHWAGEVQRIHPFNGEVRCAPAFYRAANGDRIVYLSGAGRPGLCAFKIGTQDGRFGLHEFWQAKDIFGSTVAFANAAGSPIVITTPATDRLGELPLVWVTDGGDDHNPSALWAFNGLDGTELFNSLRDPNDRSAVLPHYPPMSCTENSVFVGTNRGLACYRLPALSAAAQLNLVAFNLDHPSGGNHGYCRMTREGLDSSGGAAWGTAAQIPGWFGNENQGGGIATADINGNGRPDLVVFHIDHPSNGNHGYYRVGWDLTPAGRAASWGSPVQIPGWFGNENQGGGIAVGDLDGNGRPDLVVFHIDHPSNGNHGYYRIGKNLDTAGNVTGGWSNPIQIPGWFGNENQGGGIALADINGNGRPDLIVFHIDHPSNGNHGYYRVGWNLDAAGNVTGGWSSPIQIPGWFGNENQGGSIAVADVNGDGRPDLIVFHLDHPSNGNHGYYRIGWKLDITGNVTGGWSSPVQIPGWFGNEDQAGAVAAANLPFSWSWPDLAAM
ncbi:VCBS repeat-containing protein, partial [Bradyrhizobium sp. STM 3843]|uniref:FG-GAP repeat domain-containing protein n=1 Tax=Bradyrhizobium sp. STM 3843 TaxID=551947 RepID=UPI001112A6ED